MIDVIGILIGILIGTLLIILGGALLSILILFIFPNFSEKYLVDNDSVEEYRQQIDRMKFLSDRSKAIVYSILAFLIIVLFGLGKVLIFK